MPVPKTDWTTRFWLASVLACFPSLAAAQDLPWRGGSNFDCRRTVELPSGATPAGVVVVEFPTHGELHADAANLAVYDRSGLVPWRVLQVGPGDFCRVAFVPTARQTNYHIYYGGDEPKQTDPPTWPQTAGLLLETRQWKKCDLNRLDSVREASEAAERTGSDFVPNVFHRADPFADAPGPFFSRYRGTIQIDKAGKHKFFTSSQDASFLLIDGKQVVAAPGHHGPVHQARISGEVNLSTGPHEFEYLHAASGDDTCMVAAWQPPGADKPVVIPPEAFGSAGVAHRAASHLQHRTKGNLPDFAVDIAGEVPLADGDQPLVRVQFKDVSVKAVTMGTKVLWDFGDGQASEELNPTHVYLRPGLYAVKLSVHRGGKPLDVASRVQVRRPLIADDGTRKPDQLADYLDVLEDYDPRKLDGPSLVQIVRAFDEAGQTAEAVRVGKVAFQSNAASYDDDSLHTLARLLGPMIRDRQNDPAATLQLWQVACRLVQRDAWKAECEVEAADICLTDLLQPGSAKSLLESAEARLKAADDPVLASRLHRLWGDWFACEGDAAAARAAYSQSAAVLVSRRNVVEHNAWRGAFSRSTEAFLRDGQLDRARDELRRWESDFPGDKIEGYLPLLQAQLWLAAGKHAQAIAVANNLITVNAASAYADQLVYLAAECEQKLGHTEQARARYESLLAQYPGSPLVESSREKLASLSDGDSLQTKKTKKK
jgi:TolA-binding protein